MTIRRDLINSASRAKDVLGNSVELVTTFLKSQINTDGGFRGRSSDSDLYYTVFAAESLLAISPDFSLSETANYLRQYDKDPASMGLVDLACYIRCMADISADFSDRDFGHMIESFRTDDGGFNIERSAKTSTAYGSFLALGAFQDSGLDIPDPNGIIASLAALKTSSGGYSNELAIKTPATPATAAVISILHHLGGDIGNETIDWLVVQISPQGGFLAMEKAPVADLLSTATALYALSLTGANFSDLQEKCLDFVDTLWDGKGGFSGNCFDKVSDCEYTFYGLLALGLLSE
jgi:prenyltransferase beta subunit